MLTIPEVVEKLDLNLDETLDCHKLAGAQEGDGSVWKDEGQLLAAFADFFSTGAALEIGAQRGISTRYIASGALSGPMAPYVFSVDLHHQWKLSPDDKRRWPNVVQVTADSAGYTPPVEVEWAFIDGDHTYDGVLRDIKSALRAGAGLLVFHDTALRLQGLPHDGGTIGVEAAVRHYFKNRDGWHYFPVDTKAGLVIVCQSLILPFD